MSQPLYPILAALLALAGWAFSFYFVSVTTGRLTPNVWWMPRSCRMSEGSCQTLVETSYGTIIGRPNSFWGTLYYPMLILVIAATAFDAVDVSILVALASLAILISLYLLWGLYRLRAACPVCFATHAVNLLILFTVIGWRSA